MDAGIEGDDNNNALVECLKEKQQAVNLVLSKPWPDKDPELMKALSRIASRLSELQTYLGSPPPSGTPPPRGPVTEAIHRITEKMSRDGAWDAAEELQIQLLYFAPDVRLDSLLSPDRAGGRSKEPETPGR